MYRWVAPCNVATHPYKESMSEKNGEMLKCASCGKEFYRSKSRLGIRKNPVCSRECQYEMRKGAAPWNKDLKGAQVAWNKGKEMPEQRMEKHHGWKGGVVDSVQGYNRKRVGLEYKLEHRVIMEEFLGRELTPQEVVHHINGDRKNNKLTNLMLFSSNAEHIRYHKWLRSW